MAYWQTLATATLGTVTLDSGYTAGSGTMSLTAGQGARLPSTGDFWLMWTDGSGTYRIWKVTARSTDTLTVVADSSEGSGDANLAAGQTLRAAMTIAALNQLRQDLHQTGADASKAVTAAGNLYLPNNGVQIYRDTGAAFVGWGPIYPFTPPVSGDFAWINQGGASISTTNGGVFLNAPATASVNLRIRKKAAPSTPYTITALLIIDTVVADFSRAGIGFRESSTGKLYTLGVRNGTYFVMDKWTDPTTFSTNSGDRPFILARNVWPLRIRDNGTNLIFSVSVDGQNWRQLESEGRTVWMAGGPNEICFWADANNATWDANLVLVSWIETA